MKEVVVSIVNFFIGFGEFFVIGLLIWIGLLLLSYGIQKISKFIHDDSRPVNNRVAQLVAKLFGYEAEFEVDRKYHKNFGKNNHSELDNIKVFIYGAVVIGVVLMITKVLLVFPLIALGLIPSIVAIFSARFVCRLKTKIEKLEKL